MTHNLSVKINVPVCGQLLLAISNPFKFTPYLLIFVVFLNNHCVSLNVPAINNSIEIDENAEEKNMNTSAFLSSSNVKFRNIALAY